jgi:P4 family phage/plasmid primase-like protien
MTHSSPPIPPSLPITVGTQLKDSQGMPIALPTESGRVDALARFLAQTTKELLWWAPSTWAENRRGTTNWQSSSCIGIDVDFANASGEHCQLPIDIAIMLLDHLEAAKLPGNIAHLTPRGLRVIAVLDVDVDSRDLFLAAARGFVRQVEDALRELGLLRVHGHGFRVDKAASFDLARLFFLANTFVPVPCGSQEALPRTAMVVTMRDEPLSALALAQSQTFERRPVRDRSGQGNATAGISCESSQRTPDTQPGGPAGPFADAAARWVADHPREYPKPGSGRCEVCGHNHGCFGQLKNDPTKWACFADGHERDAKSWPGQKGDSCWFGSSLDIEANRRGCRPADVLRADGYLQPIGKAGPQEPTSRAPGAPHELTLAATDLGNSQLFLAKFGDLVCFCPGLDWLAWNGRVWLTGPSAIAVIHGHATSLATELHKHASDAVLDQFEHKRLLGQARRVSSKAGIDAMLDLASRSLQVLVDAKDLDNDPCLINCPNGVVDLRTGKLMPHDPRYLMTRTTGVDFDFEADCPFWEMTLSEIFAGADCDDLIVFLQRAAGYTMSGLTKEEIFFLLWGDGRNGKGTIVESLMKALGDYARTATMNLFLSSLNDSSKQFEVADLAGVRMVVAGEAAPGRSFDTAMLKAWTGGDERKGAHKHKPFFVYRAADTLWLLVNDKPVVRSWDAGFQERVRLIPFLNSFTEEKGNLDKNRKQQLLDELPGILAWCVRGAMLYFRDGLPTPRAVKDAVAEYRSESSKVAEFLEQTYKLVRGSSIPLSNVYARYRTWCERQGLEPMPDTRFGNQVRDAGYKIDRVTGGRKVQDIGCLPEQEQEGNAWTGS